MEDFWNKRQALWDKYRPHYLRANEGDSAANPYVFEHCVLERKMCEEAGVQPKEEDESRRLDVIDHCISVMDTLYEEGLVAIERNLADITCQRCNRLEKGYIVVVKLPSFEHERERVCTTCA